MGRRTLVCALSGAALAGCSDVAPTAPVATTPVVPAQASAPTPSVAQPDAAKPGTLVLRRTTSPARDGSARGRTARRETWSITDASLARRGGAIVLGARAGGAPTPERLAAAPPTAVLELPARAASAICDNAPAWRRETRAGALTIVTRGHGDEPWSTIETWSEGRLLTRSRSVWERRRASWQLVSQEDVASGGATQTLAVDRAGVRRASDDAPVPRVRCRDASAQIVPATVARVGAVAVTAANGLTAALRTPLGPVGGLAGLEFAAATGLATEECSPAADAEAACAVQMAAMIGAGAALAGASAAVWTACVSPAVVVVAPCVAAVSALTAASAALAVATDAYQECRDKALTPTPCGCPATPTSPAQLVSPVAAIADQDGAPRLRTAPFAIDCTQPPPPTGGGGGGGGDGGGGGGYWIVICVYTDHYDEYGNYLYTVEEGCRTEYVE